MRFRQTDLRLIGELAWEAIGISTIRNGFPGLCTQPLMWEVSYGHSDIHASGVPVDALRVLCRSSCPLVGDTRAATVVEKIPHTRT